MWTDGINRSDGEVSWQVREQVKAMQLKIFFQLEVAGVAHSYGKGEKLLVTENVPVVSCPHCGERYLTAKTLHEIERIELHRQSFAIERPVAVAAFV